MKKIVCLLILLIGVVSCGNYNANHTGPNGEVRSDPEAYVQSHVSFYNIQRNGEWHEFIVYDGVYVGGLDHWPGCKFCKEKNGKK